MKPVGILAMQGDFEAHGKALESCGFVWKLVKYPDELEDISGLVLPGGESTTLIKGLREAGLWSSIPKKIESGLPILATCAGLILCAKEVSNPSQESWNVIDVDVQRNGWGRQRESFIAKAKFDLFEESPQEMVFIRAPKITRVGEGVEILGEFNGEAVFISQNNVVCTSFHPELTEGHPVFSYFLDRISNSSI